MSQEIYEDALKLREHLWYTRRCVLRAVKSNAHASNERANQALIDIQKKLDDNEMHLIELEERMGVPVTGL